MQLQLVSGVLYMNMQFSGDVLLCLSFIKAIMNYDGVDWGIGDTQGLYLGGVWFKF